MGNWRTVHITGSCAPDEVATLRERITYRDAEGRYRGGPLEGLMAEHGPSPLCGLNDWAAESIDRVGNLAERDYSVDEVAENLQQLVNDVPSLLVRIDCGGEYESDECVATVMVGEDHQVHVLPPMVEQLPAWPEGQTVPMRPTGTSAGRHTVEARTAPPARRRSTTMRPWCRRATCSPYATLRYGREKR